MITRIRASLALASVIALVIVIGNVIQRTIVVASVRLFPSARERILARWLHAVAGTTLAILRHLGGGRWNDPPRVPCAPGTLVIMNHQSLLDIPLAVHSVEGGYPVIVTRDRYRHAKYMLISHILELYRFPVVSPGRASETQLEQLSLYARETRHPLVIYPEGHRSRDGSLGPFRKGGLAAILAARRWQVYLIVVDGFWQCAALRDFIRGLARMRGTIALLGPFDAPRDDEDTEAWIERMRSHMILKLNELRADSAAADTPPGTPSRVPRAAGVQPTPRDRP